MIYINTNLEMIAQAINVPNRVPDDAEQDFRRAVAEMFREVAGDVADGIASADECNTAPSPLFRDWADIWEELREHEQSDGLPSAADLDAVAEEEKIKERAEQP